jgi:hypothetical protein
MVTHPYTQFGMLVRRRECARQVWMATSWRHSVWFADRDPSACDPAGIEYHDDCQCRMPTAG